MEEITVDGMKEKITETAEVLGVQLSLPMKVEVNKDEFFKVTASGVDAGGDHLTFVADNVDQKIVIQNEDVEEESYTVSL